MNSGASPACLTRNKPWLQPREAGGGGGGGTGGQSRTSSCIHHCPQHTGPAPKSKLQLAHAYPRQSLAPCAPAAPLRAMGDASAACSQPWHPGTRAQPEVQGDLAAYRRDRDCSVASHCAANQAQCWGLRAETLGEKHSPFPGGTWLVLPSFGGWTR